MHLERIKKATLDRPLNQQEEYLKWLYSLGKIKFYRDIVCILNLNHMGMAHYDLQVE